MNSILFLNSPLDKLARGAVSMRSPIPFQLPHYAQIRFLNLGLKQPQRTSVPHAVKATGRTLLLVLPLVHPKQSLDIPSTVFVMRTLLRSWPEY